MQDAQDHTVQTGNDALQLVQLEEVIAVSQQQLASRLPIQAAWEPLAVHPAMPKPSLVDRVSSVPDAPKKSPVEAPAPIPDCIMSPPMAQATNPGGAASVPQAPMKPHITCFAGAGTWRCIAAGLLLLNALHNIRICISGC